MMRFLILLGVVLMILGTVLFVVALVPDPLGKAIADPLCAGRLVVIDQGDNSFELVCRGDGSDTSFTGIFIIGSVAAFLGGTLLIVFAVVGRIRAMNQAQRRLMAEGLPAQARVLAVTQSSMTVNNQPVIKFRLEVQPPGGLPFEGEQSSIVPLVNLGRVVPGMTVPVRIDPDHPEQFAIDWDSLPAPGQAAPGTLKDKLAQLEESLRAGLISEDEYQAARRRVLDEL